MPSIKTILKNLDRKIVNAGITALGQFKFENDELVKAGIPFHVYYTKDKREIYATGEDYGVASEFITRLKGLSLFGDYKQSSFDIVNSTVILKSSSTKIKEKDYNAGFVSRYFARQANDKNATIIEISKANFKKKTPYYIKESINWQITGQQNEAIQNNLREIERLKEFFDNFAFGLPIRQYWRPPLLSKKEEVLSRLRA